MKRAYGVLDPVSCVDGIGQVVCSGYNDFGNMTWLGNQAGTTPVFDTDQAGQWVCVEVHVRLDDPGQANGVHEFWIDGQLESAEQERYFDDIVVSTAPIGCP